MAQWPCPNCGGSGSMCDGTMILKPGKPAEFTPVTVCHVCQGKGRVMVTPLGSEDVVVSAWCRAELDDLGEGEG